MDRFPGRWILLCCLLFISLPWYARAEKWPEYARHGMVVSTDRVASEIGSAILQKGGNAIDAAVATGFALAVVDIKAGNIGGGGFMLLRLKDGRTAAIDYRETAPAAATRDMYLDVDGKLAKGRNHNGYLAVGVPGTVAGLALALEQYGTMSLSEVLQPAIELAENGFPVSFAYTRHFTHLKKRFQQYPSTMKTFYKPDGSIYQPGDVLVQKDLAETLKRIARNGRDGFYQGKTAELLARQMQRNGGLITKADLAGYRAIVRQPIISTYRGYTIYSMPPPS